VGRTQEQRKAETRARLLDAAADLFARKGFDAVSTDAVAAAAGRTSGAVYAHFGSKEGLLEALLRKWGTEAADEVGGAIARADDDPESRLSALWQSFVDSADHGGDAWMLLEHELWLYAARNPEARETLSRRYESARSGMATAFDEWATEADTELPAANTDLAVIAFALLLGLEMQRRVDPAVVPDDLAVAALDRMLQLD
jgi:AcrR family transcriptional regulator